MTILFLKPLKIAIDGISVVSYEVGDMVCDPHPDLAGFKDYYQVVDESALEESRRAQAVVALRQLILDGEETIRRLKADLAVLQPLPKVEPIDVELPEDDEVVDEGTKDEKRIKKKKAKSTI